MLSLELGEEIANITCDCCGKPFKSVCGFIKKDDWAYSIYFATLQTGHDEISMGLTISIGKWWDDSEDSIQQREWVYLDVRPSKNGSGFEMRLKDPDSSRHASSAFLGRKMEPEQARLSPLREEFFAIADFVLDNDPAVDRTFTEQRSTFPEGSASIESRWCEALFAVRAALSSNPRS